MSLQAGEHRPFDEYGQRPEKEEERRTPRLSAGANNANNTTPIAAEVTLIIKESTNDNRNDPHFRPRKASASMRTMTKTSPAKPMTPTRAGPNHPAAESARVYIKSLSVRDTLQHAARDVSQPAFARLVNPAQLLQSIEHGTFFSAPLVAAMPPGCRYCPTAAACAVEACTVTRPTRRVVNRRITIPESLRAFTNTMSTVILRGVRNEKAFGFR